MKKVIILKGLPSSGKSTWAKKMVDKHPGAYKIVNKDLLREMLDNGKWSKDNEKFILDIRDNLIVLALGSGKHVIIDDTNLHDKHEKRITEYVKNFEIFKDVQIETKFFDVELEECIKRDLKRENSVGEKVIRDMYNQFLKPKQEVYEPDTRKPKAIICDIDGTLAKMKNRSPYDISKVGEDLLVENIKDILVKYKDHCSIILVSGRDGECEDITREWLRANKVPYDYLYMREAGNNEKDYVIKKRIFDEHIRDRFNVLFVLDDRDRIVEMWRSLGLTCLQVAEGNF